VIRPGRPCGQPRRTTIDNVSIAKKVLDDTCPTEKPRGRVPGGARPQSRGRHRGDTYSYLEPLFTCQRASLRAFASLVKPRAKTHTGSRRARVSQPSFLADGLIQVRRLRHHLSVGFCHRLMPATLSNRGDRRSVARIEKKLALNQARLPRFFSGLALFLSLLCPTQGEEVYTPFSSRQGPRLEFSSPRRNDVITAAQASGFS
jgi:hypothetical protein